MKKLSFARSLLTGVLTLLISLTALSARAWNGTGHMLVAELAWRNLSPTEKAAVSKLLRNHPHYALLLEQGLKPGVDHDEWVFLQAATWPDMVRPSRPPQPAKPESVTLYHHADWHFIDEPYVLEADRPAIDPAAHQPEATNAVERLMAIEKQLRAPGDLTNKAVMLCWYLHLMGDIHQPLHCASWFSAEFSGRKGDSGGNAVIIKPASAPVKLHAFWDDLLGTGETYTFIDHVADTIETDPLFARAKLKELKSHKTYQLWADESFDYAVDVAYLNGELAHAKDHEGLTAADVPPLNQNYANDARALVRRRVAVAGLRLGQKLKAIY